MLIQAPLSSEVQGKSVKRYGCIINVRISLLHCAGRIPLYVRAPCNPPRTQRVVFLLPLRWHAVCTFCRWTARSRARGQLFRKHKQTWRERQLYNMKRGVTVQRVGCLAFKIHACGRATGAGVEPCECLHTVHALFFCGIHGRVECSHVD